MRFGKMHGMGHGNFRGQQFIKEIFDQLDLSNEQKEKLQQLKKVAMKDKMKMAIKFIFGKEANHEVMFNMFIGKIEAAEEILNDEQKAKLREIMIEKHKEFFVHHVLSMQENIKELIEQLELNEEQKEKAETLLTQAVESDDLEDIFKLKEELKNSLSEEQKEKAHKYFMKNTPMGKIAKELEITEEQKEKFKKMHEDMFAQKIETVKKFKAGEISFADIARKKAGMFKEVKSILNEEQIKKVKAMHRGHCHGHKKFHSSRECC
jgi:Spy/CpxP family protein refolding chaperone